MAQGFIAPVPSDGVGFIVPPSSRAHFVADATKAIWDGELLTVTFREVGLISGPQTTVAVTGEAAADAVCIQNGDVLFSLHSHSSAADESVCQVTPDGVASGVVVLRLAARVMAADGPHYDLRVNRSFSVMIRDLDTGAERFLCGSVIPDQTAG